MMEEYEGQRLEKLNGVFCAPIANIIDEYTGETDDYGKYKKIMRIKQYYHKKGGVISSKGMRFRPSCDNVSLMSYNDTYNAPCLKMNNKISYSICNAICLLTYVATCCWCCRGYEPYMDTYDVTFQNSIYDKLKFGQAYDITLVFRKRHVNGVVGLYCWCYAKKVKYNYDELANLV
jgi:hypothetical protein